jgi:Flp pilus assembly protein TadG
MVMLMMLFLGFTSLVVDLGRGMLVRRQLQASTDSAALAAARTLPNSNFSTVAMQYSSAVGSLNQNGAFTVDSISIQGKCLTTVSSWGNPCTSTSPNAVSVIESATIPTFFARVVGIKTLKVSAMSTASRGANPQPYNVAIILDTTPSMNTNDSNCGASQLQCASNAVQQLLQGLAPSLDSVSLFTFPNVTSTSVSNDYDCQSSNPTTGPYTFPSTTSKSLSTMNYKNGFSTVQMTYQILGFSGDYRSSDKSTTLSTTSNLSKAVGGKSNCTGIQTSNENTYYAGAIYAAQSALLAQQAANKGTQNVIILLSDGNATGKEQNPGGAWSAGSNDFATGIQSTTIADNSGNYPSWVGQCGQGIDAAHYASNYPNNPTTVYTIAYGSLTTSQADVYNRFGQLTQSGNCASDVNAGKHQNVSPCQAMQQMSSGWSTGDKSHFYSDYYVTGGDSGCQAGDQNNTTTSLNNIFKSILVNLTAARLIPNETP